MGGWCKPLGDLVWNDSAVVFTYFSSLDESSEIIWLLHVFQFLFKENFELNLINAFYLIIIPGKLCCLVHDLAEKTDNINDFVV